MLDVKTKTKEAIFNCFMNVVNIHKLFENPCSHTIGNLRFALRDEGCKHFNYETDSGKTTARIYEINGVFIRLNGVYQSYDGLKLQSWEFVQPKTVPTIEYVKV